jgi:hypothetical protein
MMPAMVLLVFGVVVHLGFLLSLEIGWLNPVFNDSMHRFGPGCDFFSMGHSHHGDTEARRGCWGKDLAAEVRLKS